MENTDKHSKRKQPIYVVFTMLAANGKDWNFIKSKWIYENQLDDLVEEVEIREKNTGDKYRVYLFEKYTSQKTFN